MSPIPVAAERSVGASSTSTSTASAAPAAESSTSQAISTAASDAAGSGSKIPRPNILRRTSGTSSAASKSATATTTTTTSTPQTTTVAAATPAAAQDSSTTTAAAKPHKRKVTGEPAASVPTRSPAAASSGPPLNRETSSTTANTLAPQQQPSSSNILQPRPQRPPPANATVASSQTVRRKTPSPGSKSPVPPTSSTRPPANPSPTATPAPALKLSREGSEVVEDLEVASPPSDTNRSPRMSGIRTPRSNSSSAMRRPPTTNLPLSPTRGTARMLAEHMAVLEAHRPNTATTTEEEDDESTAGSVKTVRQGRTGSVASSIAASSRQESESESGYRSEERTPTRPNASRPLQQSQPRYNRRPTVSGKEISQQGMTVETETVSSIPQVGLGNMGTAGASIRSKRSTDTIRAPRREKTRKPRTRGPPPASNASTKSELFAQRVAEAVNQANSSDSDETFVYESNPPDQRPASRFHSRTPSVTSLGGPDARGYQLPLRSTGEGERSSARRGMKFANQSALKDPYADDDDRALPGSSRAPQQVLRSHRSVRDFQDDTHYPRRTPTLRHVASSLSTHTPSNPVSPKLPTRNPARKATRHWTPQYEADIEGYEDDESTPLVRRNPRGRRTGGGSIRQLEYQNYRRRGWARTYFACIVALFSTTLVLSGIAGFLLTTTNSLRDVHIVNVTDVLVSKQEIMLDLVVEAINPNIIPVTIGTMDINIFAKSAHIHDPPPPDDDPSRPDDPDDIPEPPNPDDPFSDIPSSPSTRDSVDRGTDPDGPEDKETMLLGRIFAFDSVLQFEGTPWKHSRQISTGELRLQRPGNKTEEGGTERWERVLGHPFELIVRGVLKYQLPLSGRVRTAPVAGRVGIWPEGADGVVVGEGRVLGEVE